MAATFDLPRVSTVSPLADIDEATKEAISGVKAVNPADRVEDALRAIPPAAPSYAGGGRVTSYRNEYYPKGRDFERYDTELIINDLAVNSLSKMIKNKQYDTEYYSPYIDKPEEAEYNLHKTYEHDIAHF